MAAISPELLERHEAKARERQHIGTVRWLTGLVRLVPDFLVIGAQRSGTTTLYRAIAEHPHVVPASRKEVHFFDVNYTRGMTWYRSHFPVAWRRPIARTLQGAPLVTGEASPYYMAHPLAPARAAKELPGVKLIALLRNPIDRAFSHYHLQREWGFEPLSFEDAIAAEGERLRGEVEAMLADPTYNSFAHRRYSYLARGLYAEQLERWERFFSRDQMLVVKSEDLYADPRATVRRVLRFLGLCDREPRVVTAYNQARYAPMAPALRRQLVDFFAPHNRRLYEYLGVDLGWA